MITTVEGSKEVAYFEFNKTSLVSFRTHSMKRNVVLFLKIIRLREAIIENTPIFQTTTIKIPFSALDE